MTKLEYLKLFFSNQAYNEKAAIQAMIAIQFEDEDSSGQFKKFPYAVFVENNQFNVMVDGSQVVVDGDVNLPLCQMDDKFTLPGDFHPWLKGKSYDTTFGLLLFNIILFYEPFKGAVDYVNKEFTKPLIENLLREIMVSNPKPGEQVPEGKASVDQCQQFTKNCYFLEGLGAHFIKPGGADALTVDPRVLKLKAELMEKHKHELSDPVVVTNIIDQCVNLDIEICMSGPSRKFFIAKKFIDNSRKRMFVAFGIEPKADGSGWIFLDKSLDDGWDPNHLADYINTSVAGSYSRSMATGEGGSEVKETLRLIGRASVSDTVMDCQTPRLEEVVILESNKTYWLGTWALLNGGIRQLTKDNVDKCVGKVTPVRVPQFCRAEDGTYCKVCCGEGLGAFGERLSAEVVLIPTGMMLQRMKAHHTAGSKTSILDLEVALK